MTKARVRYYPAHGFFAVVPFYTYANGREEKHLLGPFPTLEMAVGLFAYRPPALRDTLDLTSVKYAPCDYDPDALREAMENMPAWAHVGDPRPRHGARYRK